MAGIRALRERMANLENAEKPRPSPFAVLFGSFDAWGEREVLPGALNERDMIGVVAALRRGEQDGTWGRHI